MVVHNGDDDDDDDDYAALRVRSLASTQSVKRVDAVCKRPGDIDRASGCSARWS
jgi:hypothetical protein